MRKFLLAVLVAVGSLAVPAPVSASASPVAGPAAAPAAAPRVSWEHRNFWNRIGKVSVDDLSEPIYQTSAPTPILKDKWEYKVVRWEETFETKIIPRYETRTERYVASYTEIPVMEWRSESYVARYNETPIFDWRTETYLSHYNETPIFDWRTETYLSHYNHERIIVDYEPVYSTRQVCTFRWNGSCREWGTERYQSGTRPVYGTRSTPVYATRSYQVRVGTHYEPVYATRSYQVRVGTRYEPVYATRSYQVRVGTRYEPNWDTRTVRVEVGTTTIRVSAGLSPVRDWVKVCSMCEIEGYNPGKKVLVGYEKKTVEQVLAYNVLLPHLNCSGESDCKAKNREFYAGSWYDFAYHVNVCFLDGREQADPNACRQSGVTGTGTGATTTTVRVTCEQQGLITALDGSCVPEEDKVSKCRDGVLVRLYVSHVVWGSDTDPVDGVCPPPTPVTTTTVRPVTPTTVPPVTPTTVPPVTPTTVPPVTPTTVPPVTPTTVPPVTPTTVPPVTPTTVPRIPIRPS